MATDLSIAMTKQGTHGVGNLHSHNPSTLNHGAIVIDEPIDNYTLGELGFNDEGERTVKSLSANDGQAVLVASPERRYLGEGMSEFFNGVGERARCIYPEVGETRIDTSSYALNSAVSEIKAGQVAHFDVATKKFIVSDSGSEHEDYAAASVKFVVVSNDTNILDGKEMIRIEVSAVA